MAGRPFAEHPRVERLTILLRADERAQLARAAQEAGMMLSALVRMKVFGSGDGDRGVLPDERAANENGAGL